MDILICITAYLAWSERAQPCVGFLSQLTSFASSFVSKLVIPGPVRNRRSGLAQNGFDREQGRYGQAGSHHFLNDYAKVEQDEDAHHPEKRSLGGMR